MRRFCRADEPLTAATPAEVFRLARRLTLFLTGALHGSLLGAMPLGRAMASSAARAEAASQVMRRAGRRRVVGLAFSDGGLACCGPYFGRV